MCSSGRWWVSSGTQPSLLKEHNAWDKVTWSADTILAGVRDVGCEAHCQGCRTEQKKGAEGIRGTLLKLMNQKRQVRKGTRPQNKNDCAGPHCLLSSLLP